MLDNPVWHSLVGPRRALGERHGRAARFDPAVSVFSAVDDEAGPEAWADLAGLVGPGGEAVVLRRTIDVPPGWEVTFHLTGLQMVAGPELDTRTGGDGPVPEPLDEGDAADALALIAVTDPGPFLPGTLRFGGYWGVRVGGRLVAMAGERMRAGGFTEVSAVCTDPAFRGRGLAALLTRTVVARIRDRGEEAFLHVAGHNASAIRLYEGLGFVVRTPFEVVDLRLAGVTGATARARPPEPRSTGHPGSTTTSPVPARRSG
jgi:ribosomal protein S18 acetylase RimI-like enzyme